MFVKLLRGILPVLVAASLLSLEYSGANAQASTNKADLRGGALAAVTGPIFTQPVDAGGQLYLSAWRDPDGSDNDQYVWDNFTVQSNETITKIDWIGGYDPTRFGAGGPVLDFSVSIFPSIAAGTEPAVANPPLVHYQTGGNAGETSMGLVGGIPMYTYAFSLPTPFAASAGVKYWVQIEAFQHGSLPDWGIAAGTGGNASHFLRTSGAGGDILYRSVPGDTAFTLLAPIPDIPTDISLSNTAVDENQPADTVVGELTATDPDPNATFTFSLACTNAGADDSSFHINGTNLQTAASFDFETKNTFDICIRVTNQVAASLDVNFVIMVNDVNETPTNLSLSNTAVAENQPTNTIVGALTATDPDAGATFTFSLACANTSLDDGSFNTLGSDLRTSATFDFETKSAYHICIHVTDQGGLTFDKSFVITVNNVNEAPTGLSLSNTAVDENKPIDTIVGALTASDPDAAATFTFSLTCAAAGADDSSFNILGTDLRTSAVFDFAAKSAYSLCIRVTDQGGLTLDKNFVITVNNVNGAPTDILLSNNTVDENQAADTLVGSLTALDPDTGATFTFSLACTNPGVDNSSFNILGTSLRTSAAFDFETKSSYNICIRVTDEVGLAFDKNFVITVNDVNEAPTDIILSDNTVDENQVANTVVGVLSATDPDAGAAFTFSLTCTVAGADDGSFNILGTNLRTSAVFDFETKSTYQICIHVADQGQLGFDKNFTIAVKNINEATNTAGKVTGGGTINSDKEKLKATFSFIITYKAGDPMPMGNLIYQDHRAKLRLKAISFDLLVIDGNYAWFTGTGILNDRQLVTFKVAVTSAPGRFDRFYIYIPGLNKYSAGGVVTGGNIKIH